MKIHAMYLIAILILSGCATAPQISADLQPVDSSAVKAVGYDSATQTLFVQLLSTMDVYAYQGVPASVYESFISSPSKGRFYPDKIKGKYTSGNRD